MFLTRAETHSPRSYLPRSASAAKTKLSPSDATAAVHFTTRTVTRMSPSLQPDRYAAERGQSGERCNRPETNEPRGQRTTPKRRQATTRADERAPNHTSVHLMRRVKAERHFLGRVSNGVPGFAENRAKNRSQRFAQLLGLRRRRRPRHSLRRLAVVDSVKAAAT